MLSKIFSVVIISIFSFGINLYGHCDGLDGPVVKAAIDALESKNVNLVLIWVQEQDEAEVIKAFEETLLVREVSPEAKNLADKYFFETVVRLHRAGEGESYTGLKPAGRDLGQAIPLSDLSIKEGNVDKLNQFLIHSVEDKLKERFEDVMHSKNYDKNNLNQGREFVGAYVQFIHYSEKLYELTKHSAEHTGNSKEIHKH